MHVTFKQSQFASRFRQRHPAPEGELSAEDYSLDQVLANATTIRIRGTRLPICEKNVGQAKYAFNSLQVQFMPDKLKPPSKCLFETREHISAICASISQRYLSFQSTVSTLAGFLKGGKVFTGGGIES